MPVKSCKFTPQQGGSPVDVRNVVEVSWGVRRPPSPNGHLGSTAHDIQNIVIQRVRSLHDNGECSIEPETIALSAATEKRAYFSGELTIVPASDTANVVQTIRWDSGHICSMSCSIEPGRIIERMEICVTGLTIDDASFKRTLTV